MKIIDYIEKELKELCLIDLNERELHILASVYFYCGLILEDNTYLNKSIEFYTTALKNIIDNDEISKIYNEIGETYLMLGEYTNAIKHFNLSIDNKFNFLSYINIARTMIEIGNISEAYMQICKLNINDIPESNLVDYLIIMGRILVKNEDINKAKEIYYALKELHVEEKMFSGYKNEIIIMLLEQYKGFYEYKKTSSLKKKIDEINNMLELKPNFMGMGVNFNNIISKLTSK
jgi:tetratricopeptide (TPR) repeat protein